MRELVADSFYFTGSIQFRHKPIIYDVCCKKKSPKGSLCFYFYGFAYWFRRDWLADYRAGTGLWSQSSHSKICRFLIQKWIV